MKMDPFQYQNIHFLPIIHNRLEFAQEVYRRFQDLHPQAVAVELPNTLREAVLAAVDRLPRLSVVLYREKSGRTVYLPIEPVDGIIEALRSARAEGCPVFLVDRDMEGYPEAEDPVPDPYAITRIGYRAYALAYWREGKTTASSGEDRLREQTMAFHLLELNQKYERVMMVCGMAHWKGIYKGLQEKPALPLGRIKRAGVTVGHLKESSSREILEEPPFLQKRYEEERSRSEGALLGLDRLWLYRELLQLAAEAYERNHREKVETRQIDLIQRYARNLALLQGRLTPDFYQLLLASRGMVNDNYAYEVWELGTSYPHQERTDPLPEIEVTASDLRLQQKTIRFYRRFRTVRRRLVPVPVQRRPTAAEKEWFKRQWSGRHLCSYPPEDIRVEGLGDYVKKKVRGLLWYPFPLPSWTGSTFERPFGM